MPVRDHCSCRQHTRGETHGDGNEKDSGAREEAVHVETLPDGVPSPLVISVQRKLWLSLRQNARRSISDVRHLGVKPESVRELQIDLCVCSLCTRSLIEMGKNSHGLLG
jgi:hypothetical protein